MPCHAGLPVWSIGTIAWIVSPGSSCVPMNSVSFLRLPSAIFERSPMALGGGEERERRAQPERASAAGAPDPDVQVTVGAVDAGEPAPARVSERLATVPVREDVQVAVQRALRPQPQLHSAVVLDRNAEPSPAVSARQPAVAVDVLAAVVRVQHVALGEREGAARGV